MSRFVSRAPLRVALLRKSLFVLTKPFAYQRLGSFFAKRFPCSLLSTLFFTSCHDRRFSCVRLGHWSLKCVVLLFLFLLETPFSMSCPKKQSMNLVHTTFFDWNQPRMKMYMVNRAQFSCPGSRFLDFLKKLIKKF